MSSNANPYSAPSAPAVSKQGTKKPGFCFLALAGVFLLFAGYAGSMLTTFQMFAANDMGPLEGVFDSSWKEVMTLAFAMIVTTSGILLVGGNRFEPLLSVVYIMCPIVVVCFLIGSPLRLAKKAWTVPTSFIYLVVGTGLTGVCINFLVRAYGTEDFLAIAAVLGAEVGLAMLVGALLKLWSHRDADAAKQVGPFGEQVSQNAWN